MKLIWLHCAKKPVTTMLTYPWKCTVLHCNHLGNHWCWWPNTLIITLASARAIIKVLETDMSWNISHYKSLWYISEVFFCFTLHEIWWVYKGNIDLLIDWLIFIVRLIYRDVHRIQYTHTHKHTRMYMLISTYKFKQETAKWSPLKRVPLATP